MKPSSRKAAIRHYCLTDLYFLLVCGLSQFYANNDFVFERCREVEASPDGHLDLWAREHFKSTIITYALTIQDILKDPELTVGIFSHIRPIAKQFLRQIKYEFEANEMLRENFDDVLWANPRREAPKWSEDDGIIVKRRGNPREATVEAWGLVDGMPTGKHFGLLLYDDTVTEKSVTTPDMVGKVTDAWALSRNLGRVGGRSRYIGTRYAFNDTYREMIRREAVKVRIHPATHDGTFEGEPVLWDRATLNQKRTEMGPYIAAAQLMQDPTADTAQGFDEAWLRYYRHAIAPHEFRGTKAILVDPASAKKKTSDYTAISVLGIGNDRNLYWLDGVRDRLNLAQRTRALFTMHRRWRPDYPVGYEKYGKDSDIEHIQAEMERQQYRFDIQALGGTMSKPDRIKRLLPYFEQRRFWIPESIWRTDYEKRQIDLVQIFIEEEYKPFPAGGHEDMFDAMARIFDLMPGGEIEWPQGLDPRHQTAVVAFDEFASWDSQGAQAVTEYDEWRS